MICAYNHNLPWALFEKPPMRSLERTAYAYHDYYLLQFVDQSESRVNVANAYKKGKKGRTGNASEVKNTFPLHRTKLQESVNGNVAETC